MSEPVFGRTTTAVLVGLVGASFLAWVLVMATADQGRGPDDLGPTTFDRDATGHVALVRTLEELGIPVVVSQHDSGRRAGEDGVLLVLEPTLDGEGPRFEALRGMLRQARRVLLVLPKWETGTSSAALRPEPLHLLPKQDALEVLKASGLGGDVARDGALPSSWQSPRALEFAPGPVQALAGSSGDVLVGDTRRALLVEVRSDEHHLLVLADPDPISNAGLHRGDNAPTVIDALERLREGRRAVVIDETLHGFQRPPSLTRELITPPLVYGMVHLAVLLLAFAWAASARFGSPRPANPGFTPGAAGLVGTTAALLREGGHVRTVLPRYLAGVLEHVRAELRGPTALDGEALARWLDGTAAARGVTTRVADLEQQVEAAAQAQASGTAALAAARAIDTWRQEVLDGTDRRTRLA